MPFAEDKRKPCKICKGPISANEPKTKRICGKCETAIDQDNRARKAFKDNLQSDFSKVFKSDTEGEPA